MSACLDAWAILAWLDGEERALPRLNALIDSRRLVSLVNLVEASYRIERDHGRDAKARPRSRTLSPKRP